jgi:hypothetical protein
VNAELDWSSLYETPDVDLQVSLLTDSINHLYRVCVPVRWKFVPDPRYPWMTLEIRDRSEFVIRCALVRLLFAVLNFK